MVLGPPVTSANMRGTQQMYTAKPDARLGNLRSMVRLPLLLVCNAWCSRRAAGLDGRLRHSPLRH